MAFIPANNVIKCEWVYSLEGSTCENVFYYELNAPADVSFMQSAASELKTMWVDHFRARLASALELVKIKVTSMDAQNAPGIEYTSGLPLAGLSAGECLPANCAAQITFYTGLRGRAYRGRIFVPGVPEASTNGSSLGGQFHTDMQSAGDGMLEITVLGTTYPLVVVSRQYNNTPRLVAAATVVTSSSAGNYIVSQRRRLPGRGQ